MSDSDSDMPEAVSFSTAKKVISSKQKDLNKAVMISKAKAVSTKKPKRDVEEEDLK